MFYPIENGSVYEVPDNAFGFIFKCQLPPFGYGKNISTGKIEEVDCIEFSDIPEENYWQRPLLPKDYKPRRDKEKTVQAIDPYYIDPYLQEIRKREWKRRLCGVWVKIYNPILKEVQWIYLLGLNYFYITYWKFQGKSMDFRMEDTKVFYVAAYCNEDPDCLGINEITKRKIGKTAKVGCWGYERVSRLNYHHAALQSKSDDDAKDAFKKAIIHPWQKLPDFFRPRYDTMKSEDPDELRFFPTARRGSKVEEDDNILEEALESFFDYFPASEGAADGPEIHTYIADEAGKTKRPVSILERQNIVRYCTEIDGIICGFHWYTTTVEPEKGEEENKDFQELTKGSNPLIRNENNRTTTGLYTYFLPAQKGMYRNLEYAKYGYADESENLKFLNNTINSYLEKNNTRAASSFKRKNPRNFREAFSADGEMALYDPELLSNQLSDIIWTNELTEFGNLKWKDGHRIKVAKLNGNGVIYYEPSEIYWEADPKGRFEKIAGWNPRNPNNVFYGADGYTPNNVAFNAIGADPFKYDKTKDKRRSNYAAFNYQIPDLLFKSDYDDSFTLRYSYREASTRLANEDILKMAWWCGTKVLFERNINHWKNDFIDWECGGFLSWMPDEDEPGVITSTGKMGVQTICNYTEQYINRHIKKVFFRTLIEKETGWLGFKVEDTEKFDEPMAAGITLIEVENKKHYLQPNAVSLDELFPNRTRYSY